LAADNQPHLQADIHNELCGLAALPERGVLARKLTVCGLVPAATKQQQQQQDLLSFI
jgi:hypothetical protein